MTESVARGRARGGRGDLHAGRRLALSVEALGEALRSLPSLPAALRSHAEALADGRSTVPVDGEGGDFVARVRAGDVPTEGVRALTGWLGRAMAHWIETDAPEAIRDTADVAVEARQMVLEPWESLARAYCEWFAADLPEAAVAVYRVASGIALGEAGDRWSALGCEGDLGRYVATWQRSASGWAEAVLGTSMDVDVGDLGRLRELSSVAGEMSKRADANGVSAALARQLGWPRAEVERLLKVGAAVKARTDPTSVLRKRWAIVGPIARAVGVLEKDLGRMPTVAEIAERAGVHEVSVELALEALDAG